MFVRAQIEWSDAVCAGFQQSEVSARIAAAQPSLGETAVGKNNFDTLFKPDAFARGEDQVLAQHDAAGVNARPAVNGHYARSHAFHCAREFIRKIYKIGCHES